MRRLAPLVAWCLLVAFTTILSLASLSEAAGARFRFGSQGATARRNPAVPAASSPSRLGVNGWIGCGVPLTPAITNFMGFQIVVPDGAGGATITWSDQRSGRT